MSMMQCPTASFRAMPPALTVKPRLSRHLLLFLLLLLCMAGFGYIGFHLSEEAGIRQLRVNGERQLELHARAVESEINRYTYPACWSWSPASATCCSTPRPTGATWSTTTSKA